MRNEIPEATQSARDVFPDYSPSVTRFSEEQYLVNDSPYGKIALIKIESGLFLAAAEYTDGQALDPGKIDRETLSVLRKSELIPWKLLRAGSVNEAIAALAGRRAGASQTAGSGDALPSPLLSALPAADGNLIGARRQRVFQSIRALLNTDSRPAAPCIPALWGMSGVGKHFLVSHYADTAYGRAINLPLSRVFLERTLNTPGELLLKILLSLPGYLTPSDVLVISDAEILNTLDAPARQSVLDELACAGQVLLLSRRPVQVARHRIVPLGLPGLTADEAREFLRQQFPNVVFSGAAENLLVQAAGAPRDFGVLPARLIFMTRLALSLVDGEQAKAVTLAPDEIIAARRLTPPAWQTETETPDNQEAL